MQSYRAQWRILSLSRTGFLDLLIGAGHGCSDQTDQTPGAGAAPQIRGRRRRHEDLVELPSRGRQVRAGQHKTRAQLLGVTQLPPQLHPLNSNKTISRHGFFAGYQAIHLFFNIFQSIFQSIPWIISWITMDNIIFHQEITCWLPGC